MRKNTPKYLVVHHTGGTKDFPLADTSHHTFEDVNLWHRQDPNVWLGEYSTLGYAIGYHYFCDKTGKRTQGRADYDEGAHCVGHNTDTLGYCLAGNFDLTMPTLDQINDLRLWLRSKMTEYSIPIENIVPHRKFANKSCYGNHLGDNWARSLVLPPVKKIEACETQSRVIIEKDRQINNLQKLVNYLIGLLNKNKLGSNNNFMNNDIKIKLISAAKTFATAFLVSIAVIIASADVSISWTFAFWLPLLTAGLRAGITAIIEPFIPMRLGGTKEV